ncbi:G-type lectin S-receptor-like serine/threonine-protein kinase SD2-5 [Durio zibethinus]|uniref:Receptor-like serine/threonine-protein kinase n=1 Tax=Durio zibethinus TaxID=66656 RepID=A0A6P5ZEK6_DURZI|nr:G-type lectin S-receptor-like serine/threonine-protein kinase SD2-5 [Durio zibethinus]
MAIRRNTGFAAAFLTTLLISASSFFVNADRVDYPSAAYPPNSWINVPVFDFSFWDSAGIRPILITGTFVCGFHCSNLQGNCLFAISIFQINTFDANSNSSPSTKIVWSANRNNPVKFRASLQLSEEGDLMLQDLDGTLVWNTNTTGKFVSGLNLTEKGNLVLYGRNNEMVWQSFDHPTDTLVPGQALVSGQKLTASVSTTNSSAGLYSLALINDSLIAFLEPDAQQVYFGPLKVEAHESGQHKVVYMNGRFDRFVLSPASASQFIQLGSDGHLRAYQLKESKWEQVSDLLINYTGACGSPLVCGEYGVCSDGYCSCPKAESNAAVVYFRQVSENHPDLGCKETISVSCKPSDYHSHSLLELKDFDYFYFVPHIENANRQKCKEACLKNCSCKAAIHRQQINSSVGYCFLLSKIFSFKRNVDNLHDYNSFSYIKVQNPPIFRAYRPSKGHMKAILGSTLGPILFILLVVVGMFSLWRNKNDSKDDKKEPQKYGRLRFTRFSYDYLCSMTENFSVKLGEGGFGSVYYGSLPNSTKIAVKRLDGTDRVKKSFLAEVETLGSVHHINLVSLIGFCAEKSHPLLVYEYLQNGSLDGWIFSRNPVCTLSWKLREKIIHDVAKGLAYLHDGCDQKILHLDIKPQNILLDENFNARLADFGLSKLIDRDQNQVLTTMRGTPGYMAPEWSSATITEKVDVYSFGVVILEILCGRRNIDRSQPEEEMHLLRLFTRKVEEGKLLELVDKFSEDMQSNGAEVVKMMRIAAWCLQPDYNRRPSMSKVLLAFAGYSIVEDNLSYDFLNLQAPRAIATPSNRAGTTTLALPSMLSGPR